MHAICLYVCLGGQEREGGMEGGPFLLKGNIDIATGWEGRAARLALDIARGLAYLHLHRVIHLVPSSVLFWECLPCSLAHLGPQPPWLLLLIHVSIACDC